ncbi:unnamed protein product [Rhizophagus irregularis]|uniref:Uncharacterized protein n=1 Tax=Rhizophagus irregularis TaxID=588596 RepID=A0A915ZL12_9GLOM|nr:unnamed protein product [Rhizophagus irregularis]
MKKSISSYRDYQTTNPGTLRRPNDGQNTNSPQNNPGQSRTSYNKRPSFKQLIVRFEDKSAVDYIYDINLWSIIIENFSDESCLEIIAPKKMLKILYYYWLTAKHKRA